MAHARNYNSALEQKRNIIGLNLRKYRQMEKLSKQELSNKLIMLGVDIPSKSIYHIEAGTRSVVDFEKSQQMLGTVIIQSKKIKCKSSA